MSDVVIRGMEMPKENEILVFDMWHGKIYARSTANTGAKSYEVVPLPAGHGELIDKQAFIADIDGFIECMTSVGAVVDGELLWGKLLDALANAKTIVPAEGGTKDGA